LTTHHAAIDFTSEGSIGYVFDVQVIWASDFTATAITEINTYNNNKANINRPIVLMTHEWVPEDFARKFANLPNKQTKA
jgi:hypothetical protein